MDKLSIFSLHLGLEINVEEDKVILKQYLNRNSRFEVKIDLDYSNHVCFILASRDVQVSLIALYKTIHQVPHSLENSI